HSQVGLLTFYFDPRDCRTVKAEVLICELLLQALLVCREVRRLLTPKRYDTCQILLAIGRKILLDHGTKGCFIGWTLLRAGINLRETEREYHSQTENDAPIPTKLTRKQKTPPE